MGTWWELRIGRQALPVFGKNHVPDDLMMVFTAEDRFVDNDRLLEYRAYEEDISRNPDLALNDRRYSWESHMVEYRATVATLRARLELQGFGAALVRQLVGAYFAN